MDDNCLVPSAVVAYYLHPLFAIYLVLGKKFNAESEQRLDFQKLMTEKRDMVCMQKVRYQSSHSSAT